MISNLVSLLETGVPMRWPEIRWGFMEAGVGWVPWIANRLDKEYLERRREVPHLRERPVTTSASSSSARSRSRSPSSGAIS